METIGKTIKLSKNAPEFTLELDSNRTTGYSWQLQNAFEQYFEVIDERYISPEPGLVGAPGKEIWTFKTKPSAFLEAKTLAIEMIYAQAWNIENPATKLSIEFLIEK
jgi:inhibitor of cysteine peptidase